MSFYTLQLFECRETLSCLPPYPLQQTSRNSAAVTRLTRGHGISRWLLLSLVAVLPAVAQAQFTYTTNNGAITITGYTGPGGNVTIPSTINGYAVTTLGAYAFYYQTTLTGVTIANSVTNIGGGAFFDCSGLTNITVNAANPSYASAGGVLFNKALTTLIEYPGGLAGSYGIPESVISIGDYAFSDCSGLTNITVNATNPSYASAGGVLFNKTVTTLVQCPGGLAGSYAIPDSVTNIGDGAFSYCYGLTSVTIPDSVTRIGEGAFYGCRMTNVPIPDSVTSIGKAAFEYCSGLKSVTIPGSVTNIGNYVFVSCSTLTNITVNAANPSYASAGGVLFNKALTTLIEYPGGLAGSYAVPESVTNIGADAFGNCSSLTNVTIPESVINIGIYAFGDCMGLHQAYFQGNAPSVNGGAGSADSTVFQGEAGTAYFLPGTTGWGATFGGWPTAVLNNAPADFTYTTNNGTITITGYTGPGGAVAIPGTIGGYAVTGIGAYAFSYQTNLTGVTIPGSVTSVGIYAFEYCTGLHQAYFEGNAPSVDGGAGSADSTVFAGESGTAYYVPGTIGWGATFGGWPTAVLNNAPADFTYTTINGTITITGYTGPGGNVTIPGTIYGFPVTAVGAYAFSDKTNLTGVTIPDSVTNIGDYAFDDCYDLTSVTIGDNVTSIGAGAFSYCSGLRSVVIPDSVIRIGTGAFGGTRLTSVTIPSSVTNMGSFPFEAFTLTAINVNANNPVYSSVSGVLFDKDQSALIEFPDGLRGSYIIPNGVISILGEAFENASITNVRIPKTVTSVGYAAFNQSALTSVTIPDNVDSIGTAAFDSCRNLTNVTIGFGLTNIGEDAFAFCGSLSGVYFKGNAPNADSTVFAADKATAYYLPGTAGWGPTLGGIPTAPWFLPNPLILNNGPDFGVSTNGFDFTISWATNATVVVEACTNLTNPVWLPVSTNTLTGGSSYFSDPQWANYHQRFYHLRSP